MRVVSIALVAVALIAFTAGSRASAQTNTDQRLLSLAQLWGNIRYFDPWLAHQNVDWDAAALSAIPQVERASSASDFSSAVERMLAALNDPLTQVAAPSPSPSAAPSAGPDLGLAFASPNVRTAVLTVNSNAMASADDEPLKTRAAKIAVQLASRRSVIIDLRQAVPESDDGAAAVDWLLGESRVGTAIVYGDVSLPVYRRRYYNGLPEATPAGYPIYHGGFISDDVTIVRGTAPGPLNVAFLVNHNTILPDLAVALLQAGKAVALADGPSPALSAGDADSVTLADGVTARLRVSELTDIGPTQTFAQPLPAGAHAAEVAADWLDHHTIAPVQFAPPPTPTASAAPPQSAGLPDEAHRIFAVFKIYNVIRYFFPYRNLMGTDWNAATLRAIGDARAATDERGYIATIRRYYAHIHDGHGSVTGPAVSELYGGGMPWTSRYLHGEVVVTEITDPLECQRAGVRLGDVVTAVDGLPVQRALNEHAPFVNGSTPQGVFRNLLAGGFTAGIFTGLPGSAISVTLRHARSTTRFTARFRRIEMSSRHPRTGAIVRVLPGDVGYVDLDRLPLAGVDAMFSKLRQTRAIVFDDRGYPNGTAWAIAPRLTAANEVRAATIEQIMALGPYLQEGELDFSQSFRTDYQMLPAANGFRYLRPTVMLLDERTISQAEHTALFFSAAGRTKFVGTPTDGANGDITKFVIPGNLALAFSGLSVRYADGRQLQRVGILPDIRSEPTAQDVAMGRDVVLEAGLKEALQLSGAPSASQLSALHQLQSIDRLEFVRENQTLQRTAALERVELDNVGKPLPGATGAHPLASGWGKAYPAAFAASTGAAGSTAPQIALSSKDAGDEDYGTVGQSFDATAYRGKCVHIFGVLQTTGAPSGGAVWARVDGPSGPVSIDNMSDRMPRGTQPWQPFSIVLNVPPDAAAIVVGLMLFGHGEVAADRLMIEPVPADMPPSQAM
ncbi:MAG: hypothetical protein JO104_06090 [Candidatus Eremiobacteraeota bacterium]|nr:hypothetical protein [Candidatus Eremiobacteraeota bacterium]